MANEQGSDHGEDSAFSAFKNGDFSTAAKQYLPGATQGNLNSQYMLGLCLTQPGSQQEFAAAAEWFRKAAAQGHTQAYYQLGNLYRAGSGVPLNCVEAERCWQKAAQESQPAALFNLGNLYISEDATGVPGDLAKAYSYYDLAVAAYREQIASGAPLQRYLNDAIQARRRAWRSLKREQLLMALSKIGLSRHYPILRAARAGNFDEVRALLASGVNADTTFTDGSTPLIFAAHKGHRAVAELLISYGANVNITTKHLATPLHVASQSGSRSLVELILEHGGRVNAKTGKGITALHTAAESGYASVAEVLIRNGGDVNARTDEGATPFICRRRTRANSRSAGPRRKWR